MTIGSQIMQQAKMRAQQQTEREAEESGFQGGSIRRKRKRDGPWREYGKLHRLGRSFSRKPFPETV